MDLGVVVNASHRAGLGHGVHVGVSRILLRVVNLPKREAGIGFRARLDARLGILGQRCCNGGIVLSHTGNGEVPAIPLRKRAVVEVLITAELKVGLSLVCIHEVEARVGLAARNRELPVATVCDIHRNGVLTRVVGHAIDVSRFGDGVDVGLADVGLRVGNRAEVNRRARLPRLRIERHARLGRQGCRGIVAAHGKGPAVPRLERTPGERLVCHEVRGSAGRVRVGEDEAVRVAGVRRGHFQGPVPVVHHRNSHGLVAVVLDIAHILGALVHRVGVGLARVFLREVNLGEAEARARARCRRDGDVVRAVCRQRRPVLARQREGHLVAGLEAAALDALRACKGNRPLCRICVREDHLVAVGERAVDLEGAVPVVGNAHRHGMDSRVVGNACDIAGLGHLVGVGLARVLLRVVDMSEAECLGVNARSGMQRAARLGGHRSVHVVAAHVEGPGIALGEAPTGYVLRGRKVDPTRSVVGIHEAQEISTRICSVCIFRVDDRRTRLIVFADGHGNRVAVRVVRDARGAARLGHSVRVGLADIACPVFDAVEHERLLSALRGANSDRFVLRKRRALGCRQRERPAVSRLEAAPRQFLGTANLI